jgi:hypothetical protein
VKELSNDRIGVVLILCGVELREIEINDLHRYSRWVGLNKIQLKERTLYDRTR